jgi:hypothetical protein
MITVLTIVVAPVLHPLKPGGYVIFGGVPPHLSGFGTLCDAIAMQSCEFTQETSPNGVNLTPLGRRSLRQWRPLSLVVNAK